MQIFYRQIDVVPGDDSVFAINALFRAAHGYMRSVGAEIVIAPTLKHGDGYELMMHGGIPNGLRFFANNEDFLRGFSVQNSPDSVFQIGDIQAREVKPGDRGFAVKTFHRVKKGSPAHRRRLERRMKERGVDMSDGDKLSFDEDAYNPIARSGKTYFWVNKDDKKIPVFLSVDLDYPDELVSKNTFGCGTAFLFDLRVSNS